MRKIVCILLLICPVIAFTQQNGRGSSPSDDLWMNVGNACFSSDSVDYTSLAFNQSGQPCVAFLDNGNQRKASVMRFDGTDWVPIGSAGFSAGEALHTKLAFDPAGQPYLAYEDYSCGGKATVIKYDTLNTGLGGKEYRHLSISPNPAWDKVTVDLSSIPGEINSVEIDDMKGTGVFGVRTRETRITVDVGAWPAGIYTVRVKQEHTEYSGKFCKQ
jgi:hypothetical protein